MIHGNRHERHAFPFIDSFLHIKDEASLGLILKEVFIINIWFTLIYRDRSESGIFETSFCESALGSTYIVRVTRLEARNTKKIKVTSKKLTAIKLESKSTSAGLCEQSTTLLVDLNLSLRKDTGSDLKRSFLTQ